MKTLAVISHKGGAGKTSTTVMLAEEMARRGLRVALVDADRQKGAGLLLGIEQPSGTIQQTQNPKLCYLCSAGIPLRELPTRAAELQGAFDVVLVDTPSLDDPLARAWLQYTQFVLLTIPVEPISIRTLDGADAVVQQAKRMNRQVHPIGLLPTMYDESDATQRQLLSELLARRAEEVLAPAIPHDPSLAHRAEQREERRTEPLPTTRQAYQQIVDHLARGMALEMQAAVPFLVTSPRRAPAVGAPPLHRTPAPVGAATAAAKPAPSNRPARRFRPALWVAGVAVVAVLVLLGVFLSGGLGARRAGFQPLGLRRLATADSGSVASFRNSERILQCLRLQL